MNREDVLDRIDKLDVLYKELDVLDEKLQLKSIQEIEYLIDEIEIKKKIDKLFKV
jgi:hypothetical protein